MGGLNPLTWQLVGFGAVPTNTAAVALDAIRETIQAAFSLQPPLFLHRMPIRHAEHAISRGSFLLLIDDTTGLAVFKPFG